MTSIGKQSVRVRPKGVAGVVFLFGTTRTLSKREDIVDDRRIRWSLLIVRVRFVTFRRRIEFNEFLSSIIIIIIITD